MNPIDLFPIKRPLEDENEPDSLYFYNNVISELIPDVIRMTSNGIPIDLDKVSNVEDTVNNVLQEVKDQLASNPLMLEFLKSKNNKAKEDKANALEAKKKTVEDFIKPFSITNKIHRTYVINTYLMKNNKEDMVMDDWSIKDVKKLNQIIGSKFIANLIDKKIELFMFPIIDEAMLKLAQDKSDAYNKNHIEDKIEALSDAKLINSFNPGSSLQKQEFFAFYDIEATEETKKGNPQWDRSALEDFLHLLDLMIEEKE